MGRLRALLRGCLRAVGCELRLAGERAAIAFYGRWVHHLAEPPPTHRPCSNSRPGLPSGSDPTCPASPVERELWRQLADVALPVKDAGPGSPA